MPYLKSGVFIPLFKYYTVLECILPQHLQRIRAMKSWPALGKAATHYIRACISTVPRRVCRLKKPSRSTAGLLQHLGNASLVRCLGA